MKVVIVNYGMGNLGSVRQALADLGASPYIAEAPGILSDATHAVLPGVGAYAEGMLRLAAAGWIQPIRDFVELQRKPLLGICLGMQMLMAEGDEGGITAGLNLIDGRVRRLDQIGCQLRIPHVGWNDVTFSRDERLFFRIPQASDFYFVHSYAVAEVNSQDIVATTVHGVSIVAAIRRANVFGTQFHPEKSSKAGRQVLRNFLECGKC